MSRFPSLYPISLAVALSLTVAVPSLRAQTCADPVANDFRVDTLANNATGDLFENSSSNGGESGSYGVVQMTVVPNGKVFIAKMCSGQIRVYRPGVGGPATATVLAGRVPTHCDNEDGVLGIVADRNFMTNRWVYVFHTDATYATSPANADTGKAHVLTRYTYDSTAAAGSQLVNPKVILRFPRMIDSRAYHAAGGLDMGADGVMVIGTGDDTSPHRTECSSGSGTTNQNNAAPILWNDRGCDAQKSSANTASLRGKMLRIMPIAFSDDQTPTPGIGTTYKIPPGNLWEKIDQPAFNPNWNPSFTSDGTTARDSVSRVRKEIYTMGHRNPYHPRYDMKSGWIFTGEVGLDQGSPTDFSPSRGPEGREEWNLATAPGFYGHPYCVGSNTPWRQFTYPNTTWTTAGVDTFYNCAAVRNVSPNNYGIINLPPARAASLWYSTNNTSDDGSRLGVTADETAVGGPMYRYDSALSAAGGKFPPQYEGKVFFFDWANTNKNSFRVITVNPDGTVPAGTTATPRFPASTLAALPNGGYIDMRFGPHDGAMYLLRNNTGGAAYNGFNNAALYRIRYVGTIDNSCYTPFNATVGPGPVAVTGRAALRRTLAPLSVSVATGWVSMPVGYRTVRLYDLSGREVWSHAREAADRNEELRIPANVANGILQARFTP
jgi:cytochrome c